MLGSLLNFTDKKIWLYKNGVNEIYLKHITQSKRNARVWVYHFNAVGVDSSRTRETKVVGGQTAQ